MRLLAIDTALEACSVGIAVDDRPSVLMSEEIGRGHAERLPPMIAAALGEAGLSPRDIERIAVTVGPGSFTGVRIGIAAARGFALVTGSAMVGIGTLTVLAESARATAGAKPVFAALDARGGEIYAQLFDANGAAIDVPRVGTAADFISLVGADTVLAGSGADAIARALGEGAEARIAHRQACPDLVALIRLGRIVPADAAPPRPLYLRPPDARPQAAAKIARR